MCFCAFGYRYNHCTKKCESPPLELMSNSTAAIRKQEANDTLMNVSIFCAWVGAFVMSIMAFIGIIYRKFRVKQEPGYALLE